MAKPDLTGTSHKLPFQELAPLNFERLCLWLVNAEKYERAEHLGESGGEGGRDVQAWKDGRRFVFQCKRVQAFGAAGARKEIAKLRCLPSAEQPHELVFVVSRAVTIQTRTAIRKAWGDEATCHFWAGSELDAMVKKHPELLAEFFQLPAVGKTPPFRHNLPFASLGPFFHGRAAMLSRLRETLERTPAGRAAAIAGKAVHGLGGVGKTRLAIEYGWHYAAEYWAVLFVGAGAPADLRRNLAALCAPGVLDLPEQGVSEEEVQVEAVLRRLGEQPVWLLILDNVDSKEAAAAVDALVPRLHGGHVLLTGRLARWGAEVEPIELDVLQEEAAAGFLLARTAGRRRATPDDAAQAAVLARELGCLPLALEQAGAAIAERRLSFAGYQKEWHSRRDQVLTWFDPRVSHYPESLAVTWQTSVDRLTAPARRLLERLAWLGPEPIPESLLEVPVPGLSEDESSLDPHDALLDLATYSLVTPAAKTPTFTVHRLVQDVTRRSLRKEPGQKELTEALAWVGAAFVGHPQDVRTWPLLDPLAPHARAVVAFADEAEIPEPTARLMNDLGQLFKAKALHGEAEPLMRRALAIDEKSFGTEHPNVARDLNNLALLLKDTNRLGEAEPLMRRTLAIAETSIGTEHPSVATALNNLATLLQATDRLGEAEPLIRRALAIDEKSFGTEHPDVARDLNNLARLLQATNRLGEAEPLMRRALAIDEKSFGTDHPEVATDLNNLALLLQDTNRLGEAEPLMRRSLAIVIDFTRRTGHEHPHLQAAFGNYRRLLQEMGKSDGEIEAAIAVLVGASE
jgi:tetratricopeptide (TPR) repeat protein